MSNEHLIAEAREYERYDPRPDYTVIKKLADALEGAEADLQELRGFIAEKSPWTGEENWHKFEGYRTPELVRALGAKK